jgi:hypothetical protein
MATRSHPLYGLLLALASCGPTVQERIDDAHTALNSGRAREALDGFTRALADLPPSDAGYFEARLGRIEALAECEPAQVPDAWFELAAEFPERAGEQQCVYISGRMISAREFHRAIEFVDQAIRRSGEKPPALVAQMARIKKEAANDKTVIDALAGLGY